MSAKLSLKIVPGSSRDTIAGWYGSELKIKLRAPPEKGRANQALLEFLSSALHVPQSTITLISGHTSPHKVVEIAGLEQETVFSRLKL